MANAYAGSYGSGYVNEGPGTGPDFSQQGGSDSGLSLDAADYAETGGTAQGSMSIRTEVPAGYVNSCGMEVPDPVVKTPDMYTYDYLVHDLDALFKRYGKHMRTEVLGRTLDGRNVYEVSVGNRNAGTHILINASIHAREYITTNLLMKQMEYLLYFADTGSFDGVPLRTWLDRVCFHFVPMINPDGVSISQFGLNGIQKEEYKNLVQKAYAEDVAGGHTSLPFDRYLVRWKANARGVNLNQNFDVMFGVEAGRATGPSAEDYKGAYAGSEPETQLMTKLLNERHYKAVLNYHSMGNILYWDVENNPLREHCRDLANNLSLLTGYPLRYAGGGGAMKEYAQLKNDPATSITLEIGALPAPVPASEMGTIWGQNKFVPLYTMKWAYEKGK